MLDAEEVAMTTPHDELCDKALEHYREISNQAMHSNSLVPAAIEYYRRWRPKGERKIVSTPETLIDALAEGWVFDPWLGPRGTPVRVALPTLSTVEPHDTTVWFLVKGTPEQIAALEPFVELPKTEEAPMPESAIIPYAVRSEYIAYNDKGEPSRTPKRDYVIMHKDHIYKAGSVYTLPPGEDAMQRSNAEAPESALEG